MARAFESLASSATCSRRSRKPTKSVGLAEVELRLLMSGPVVELLDGLRAAFQQGEAVIGRGLLGRLGLLSLLGQVTQRRDGQAERLVPCLNGDGLHLCAGCRPLRKG